MGIYGYCMSSEIWNDFYPHFHHNLKGKVKGFINGTMLPPAPYCQRRKSRYTPMPTQENAGTSDHFSTCFWHAYVQWANLHKITQEFIQISSLVIFFVRGIFWPIVQHIRWGRGKRIEIPPSHWPSANIYFVYCLLWLWQLWSVKATFVLHLALQWHVFVYQYSCSSVYSDLEILKR